MSLNKILALDKVGNFFRIISQSGGIRGTLFRLFRQSELKDGVCVGMDELGNKYYENPRYFMGRSRWVEYNPNVFLDFDASQVSAQWYGWLHYKTDLIPTQDPSRPKYKWMAPHVENLTGTKGQYMAYSTTRPKIEAWNPNTAKQST